MDRYPPNVQRPALLKFVEALRCLGKALRRDENGDWRIQGRHGHIYAIPEGFQIVVSGWSTKGWNAAKRELRFAKMTQEGPDEGILLLTRPPKANEIEPIRHWVGIPKRRNVSAEKLARLREWASERAKINAQKTASTDPAGT